MISRSRIIYLPDMIFALISSTKYILKKSKKLNKECNIGVLTVESKITYKDNFSFPVTRFSTVNGAPYLEMYDYIAHRHKDRVQAICFVVELTVKYTGENYDHCNHFNRNIICQEKIQHHCTCER